MGRARAAAVSSSPPPAGAHCRAAQGPLRPAIRLPGTPLPPVPPWPARAAPARPPPDHTPAVPAARQGPPPRWTRRPTSCFPWLSCRLLIKCGAAYKRHILHIM